MKAVDVPASKHVRKIMIDIKVDAESLLRSGKSPKRTFVKKKMADHSHVQRPAVTKPTVSGSSVVKGVVNVCSCSGH